MKYFTRNYILGSSILLFLSMQYVIPSILFFFKITVSPVFLPVCLVITFLWIGFLCKKYYSGKKLIKQILINLGLLMLFIALSMWLAISLYDVTFDGQFYHQDAVIFLRNGWNPVYEYLNFDKIIDFYSKAAWIIWSCCYSLTDLIELGKYSNVLLIFGSYFMAMSAMQKINKLHVAWQVIFSVIIALNPVSVYQSVTYYLDGVVSSIIICLVSLFIIYHYNNKIPGVKLLVILTTVLLANLKFTGLGFAVILLGGFLLFQILQRNRGQFVKLLTISIIAGVFGVGILGYQTYIKNFKDNGHPFYPLNDGTLLDAHRPANLNGKNRFQKLFISNFSRCEAFLTREEKTKPKVPFDTGDKRAFATADVKVGGFGSMFGGILILTTISLIILLFTERKKGWMIYYMLSVLFISVVIVSGTWWARYVPQFFLIPVVICIYALASKNKANKIISYITLAAFLFNIYLFATVSFERNIQTSRAIRKEFKNIGNRSIELMSNCFESTEKRFSEKGIQYEVSGYIDFRQSIRLKGGVDFTRFRFSDKCYRDTVCYFDFEKQPISCGFCEVEIKSRLMGEEFFEGEKACILDAEKGNEIIFTLKEVKYGEILELNTYCYGDSINDLNMLVNNSNLELSIIGAGDSTDRKKVYGTTIFEYDYDSIEIRIRNSGHSRIIVDNLSLTYKQVN